MRKNGTQKDIEIQNFPGSFVLDVGAQAENEVSEEMEIPYVAGLLQWEPPHPNTAIYFPPHISTFEKAFELSYLSVATTARRMGIVLSGIQKRVAKNQIEHVRVNGRTFIPSHVPAVRDGRIFGFRVVATTARGLKFSRIIYDKEEFVRFARATSQGEWQRISRAFRPWNKSRPAEIWHTEKYFVYAMPPEHPDNSTGKGKWLVCLLDRNGKMTTSILETEETWNFFFRELERDADGAVEKWFVRNG